jgi:hypothetical protein
MSHRLQQSPGSHDFAIDGLPIRRHSASAQGSGSHYFSIAVMTNSSLGISSPRAHLLPLMEMIPALVSRAYLATLHHIGYSI